MLSVYETCKLGTHSPQISGTQMELSPGKYLPSGLVLVDCPQQLKIASNSAFAISSTSDYFQALAKGWDRKSFISSLSKVLRDLKLAAHSTVPQKEGTAGPITVCHFIFLYFVKCLLYFVTPMTPSSPFFLRTDPALHVYNCEYY